ncbi:undecaprenyl-diphosphate phosphatase [Gordonia jinhuaensis]|uniref:Undecaprenyl-diphosphatase n=1 Tax=Gordonia jinhuaensis TaxID=1517702 RepID=A0A916T762_9ACTN|nr:undecaprenyl-diphosphate phosphatase [Gordonia jinhuaensis]GGB33052.1 undecaprenyl-diphosphatase [Gordonia jinhuaensis]
MSDLSYPQAVVMGLLQGVTELFPVSSLGHSLLVPAWLGGSWQRLVTESNSRGHTPFLAFVVALHVATAFALIAFYWRDWVRIVGGFVTSIRTRRADTAPARLAWLIIVGTIPVGVVGLVAEKPLRVLFATPLAAAIFLFLNGLVLLAAELLRRRQIRTTRTAVEGPSTTPRRSVGANEAGSAGAGRGYTLTESGSARTDDTDEQPTADLTSIDELSYRDGAMIGACQILALLPGISRSGATISGGILRRLNHEDAARFAFLLATPVILAAGVLKIPELFGPEGHGIGGQVVVGSICAFVAAFVSVAFLARWFHARTLFPFVVYCLVAGAISIVHFA